MGYLHLFYADQMESGGINPYQLVDSTKGEILSRYLSKAENSAKVEKEFEGLLNIDIGEVISSNDDSLSMLENINNLNQIFSNFKDAEQNLKSKTAYIRYLNQEIIPSVDKLVQQAISLQGFTSSAVTQLQQVQQQLKDLKNRLSTDYRGKSTDKGRENIGRIINLRKSTKNDIVESDIREVVNGIFNGARGAFKEIADTIGFAQLILQANKEITSVTIGSGSSSDFVEIKEISDPLLAEDIENLKNFLSQSNQKMPKEDVAVYITDKQVTGTVSHVGISSKSASRSVIGIHSTNLRTMLETAYPGQQNFLYHLMAGLSFPGSTTLDTIEEKYNTRPFPTIIGSNYTKEILQTAWKKTYENAYKMQLADYIAGNGSVGNNVNYLIVNDKVFSISSILRQLSYGSDGLVNVQMSNQAQVDSRWAFLQHQVENFANVKEGENPNARSTGAWGDIEKTLTATKVKISLNYGKFKSL